MVVRTFKLVQARSLYTRRVRRNAALGEPSVRWHVTSYVVHQSARWVCVPRGRLYNHEVYYIPMPTLDFVDTILFLTFYNQIIPI